MKTTVLFLFLCLLWFGPADADPWVALWTWDDAWVGMKADGEVWHYNPGNEISSHVGSFGAGPWVAFSKSVHDLLALKQNGEIWAMNGNGSTWLFLSLPSDKEWCALLTSPEGPNGPYFAMTCDGEIWVTSDPPQYAGSFLGPVPTTAATFGEVKGLFR